MDQLQTDQTEDDNLESRLYTRLNLGILGFSLGFAARLLNHNYIYSTEETMAMAGIGMILEKRIMKTRLAQIHNYIESGFLTPTAYRAGAITAELYLESLRR